LTRQRWQRIDILSNVQAVHDQVKGEYFGELRRCMERLKQTKTDIIFVVTIITSD